MKNILLLLIFFITTNICLSQNLIAVQNGDTPEFYSDLSEAIEGAVSGDTLYLPNKSYAVSDTIRKTLHLVGVGFNLQSSSGAGMTILTKRNSSLSTQLHFESGSEGSSITGIRFESTFTNQGGAFPNITSSNDNLRLSLIRNYFRAGVVLNSSQCLILENFFGIQSRFGGSSGVATLISNNVFFGNRHYFANSNLENNIITASLNTENSFTCNNSVFKNNIFAKYPFVSSFASINSTFINNVNMRNNSFGQSSNGFNNVNNAEDLNTIFNEPNWNQFLNSTSDFKFELPENSTYLTFASDGGQVGIYGGRFPWKDGSIPFNPHIVSKNISGTTDENGNLQIEIEVQAQGN